MTWHTITHIAGNVHRITEPFGSVEPRVGVTTANVYLVVGRDRAALIDTGMGIADLRPVVRSITPLPCTVLNTHYHWDHCGGNALFGERAIHASEAALVAQEPDLRFYRQGMASPSARAVLPAGFDPTAWRIQAVPPTRLLHDGDRADLGGRQLTVIHVPGHSPGHVAYLDTATQLLFTGDTAYRGPLFACFEGSDPAAFARSVQRLAALPGVSMLCPGHDDLIAEPAWLNQLAAALDAAISGDVPGQLRRGFVEGREFAFDGFSIWLAA